MEQKDSILTEETKRKLTVGMQSMLVDIAAYPNGLHDPANIGHHLLDTPQRVLGAYEELFSGVGKDPAAVLKTSFEENHYDQMITVCNIDFVSVCMHHLLPFHGMVHFAYLPRQRVVGLSKIPRLVEILSRRPQIQEQLTQQIVEIFQRTVDPLGCAAMVEAWHACVGIRGVRKPNAVMRTTALTGPFLEKPGVKEEFFAMVRGTK